MRKLVRKSLEEGTGEEFEERVEEQAEFLKDEIREGNLDNSDYTIGLEIEVYSIDTEGRLARLPSEVFDACGDRLNKELGLHNAEINTSPTVLSEEGLEGQAKQVLSTLDEANGALKDDGQKLVLDSMWTVPPKEGSVDYLSNVTEEDGIVSAENMRADERYEAIDNFYLERVQSPVEVSVPGAELSFPSILVESLATSIQPHHQVPRADDLPRYYNTAMRTMGPLLALTTNSPFLPPDLYPDPDESLTEETYHELRVPVFEQSVNPPGEYDDKKVRFPRDINRTEDMLDKVIEDRTYSPILKEWNEGQGQRDTDGDYTDSFWEFEYKRGTYWRWLRAVIGGESVGEANDERSVRIEYRPVPTQPSVRDMIGLQALVSGMLAGMAVDKHPLPSLEWQKAYDSFYSAVENGINGDLAWVDEDGTVTYDKSVIYDEVFRYAKLGLEGHGVGDEVYEKYVEPLRLRWEKRTTPSVWKIDRVQESLDNGADFEEAVHRMQRDYFDMAEEHDTFADWI